MPNNRGSPIFRYYITIIQLDGTSYTEAISDCVGDNVVVLLTL